MGKTLQPTKRGSRGQLDFIAEVTLLRRQLNALIEHLGRDRVFPQQQAGHNVERMMLQRMGRMRSHLSQFKDKGGKIGIKIGKAMFL